MNQSINTDSKNSKEPQQKAICQAVTVSVAENVAVSPSDVNPADEEVPQEILETTALTKQDWSRAQREDRSLSLIHDFMTSGQRPDAKQVEALKLDKRYMKEWSNLKVKDGILLRTSTQQGQETQQLVLPEKFRDDIFKAYHEDLGHQERDRTLSLMRRRVFWPGMDSYV